MSLTSPTTPNSPSSAKLRLVHEYPSWLDAARQTFNADFRSYNSQLEFPRLLCGSITAALALGRRIRPSLYYAFWCANTGEYPTDSNALPAIAIEYFHAASIIVDDIADGELRRRNKIPVYREFGTDFAILTAHYLTSLGFKALQHPELPTNILNAWTDRYAESCSGQANDYGRNSKLTLEEQQRESLAKTTAFFKFVGDGLDILFNSHHHSKLLGVLGEMFQIGNDVVGLLNFEESERHADGEDYTIRLSYLVPMLIKIGALNESELFSKLPYKAHVRIAQSARSAWPQAEPILKFQLKSAERRIQALNAPLHHKTMAQAFIDHCCMTSFWNHNHAE